MKVAILGLGYVGTVTAAGLASQGHDVVGVDVDRRKVATINAGQSPVVEPGVDRMVAEAVSAGRPARHHRRRRGAGASRRLAPVRGDAVHPAR